MESYEFSGEIIAAMMGAQCWFSVRTLKSNPASNSFFVKYSIDKEDIEGISVFEIDNRKWDFFELQTY
jgi:hypothetical protein